MSTRATVIVTRRAALVLLAVWLSSCRGAPAAPGLVGRWQQTSPIGQYLLLLDDRLEFWEDGTFIVPGKWSGRYALDDRDHVAITAQLANAPLETRTYQFAVDGDRLSLSDQATGVTLEFERIGEPDGTIPPTLHPSPSATPVIFQ